MLLDSAQEIHAAGRLQEAIALYGQVLASEPTSYRANYLMGIALCQAGQAGKGVGFLKTAARIRPDGLEAQRDLGIILLRLRDHAGAEAALARAAELDKGNPQVLVNRGIALRNLGRAREAADCQRAALALDPGFAEARLHLGNALLALGEKGSALESFRAAAALKPSLAEAWQGAAQALLDRGETDAAITVLREAVQANLLSAGLHCALGLALLRAGRGADALVAIDGALALDSAHAGALAARGATLESLRRPQEALIAYAAALEVDPRSVDALLGQAGVLRELGFLDRALAVQDRAIELAPERGDAYFGAGLTFLRRREYAAAVRSFAEGARLMPGLAAAHHQHAQALKALGSMEEALTALDRAIAADGGHVESYLLKAQILSGLQQWEAALGVLESARAVDPLDRGLGQRFGARMQICDWREHDPELREICRRIAAGDADIGTFNALAHLADPALQRRYAEACAAAAFPDFRPAPSPRPGRGRDGRITIAYVSGDFRDHASMYLMADVFEHHDRGRFRLVGLSLKKQDTSIMRARVRPHFDAFHDLDAMTDDEVLALARDEGIDIAVDMMGATRHGRPSLFAARLAPVQVSYLAYAGTMGLPTLDYLIADPVLIPAHLRQHYTEKIAWLPDSYQPNDRKRVIAPGGAERSLHGLPADAFVFCCFNNTFKITPSVFDSWMRILAGAPGSVLWLLSAAPEVEGNLRGAAAARGIDPARLVFARPQPLSEHLARHRAADLFLDTLPYNAHTTASDALWAGLPVLTLAGETFASRVAASLLSAAGLPDLVAGSRAEYERMALRFSQDRESLEAVRHRLEAGRLTCALFDSARYTRNLEGLFSQMIARHDAGLPPDHLAGGSTGAA